MGKYTVPNGRGFVPLDKSQSKHPKRPPRPQIPVDADWTSSSAIFTVCRRIDLYRCVDAPFHSVGCVRGPRARATAYHLRLYMHINRDNRGSPEAAYRAGAFGDGCRSSRGLCGVRPAKGISLPREDPACKWSAFIVRKQRRMNM